MGPIRTRSERPSAQLLAGLLALVFLLAGIASAQDSIETFALQNRPAAEIIPIVKPLLREGEAVTGDGFTLILRAGPDTREQVRSLLADLDKRARTLKISVLRTRERLSDAARLEAAITVKAGNDAEVSLGRPHPGADGVQIHADKHYSAGSGRSINSLTVSSGQTAYIDSGSAVPYPSATVTSGGAVVGGIEYRQLRDGFAVKPQLLNDHVALEISPIRERQSGGGSITHEAATTRLTGRIGEWLLIGGNSETVNRSGSGIVRQYSTTGSDDWYLYVRAVPVE